jgi:hypothetical protein
MLNTWNTLPESYQLRVYNNTLGTLKCQIQQAENPTPDMVIITEEASVDNAILTDYLTFEVALEEPQIKSTDPIIPMDNNCTDDQMHFGIERCSGESDDQDDKCDEGDAFPNANWPRCPGTAL